MKLNHLSLAAVCACVLFAGSASAQQPASSPVQVLDAAAKASATTVTAVVAALDARNHIVTLKAEDGNEFAVHAGGAVKLGGIAVGDTVAATYIHAVALDFQKGDGIRMEAKSLKADGNLAEGAALKRTTLVTNIWGMNASRGTVTVLGPYGHLTEVHLKDPALLSGVKVGDQMKITYTQAVATSVVKKA
jgi:Cu/Ag efflux protein CusF